MKAEKTKSHPDIVITMSWEEAERLHVLLKRYEGSEWCIVLGQGYALGEILYEALDAEGF